MKIQKLLILITISMLFVACKAKIDTKVNVLAVEEGKRLEIVMKKGGKLELPQGEIKAQFKVPRKSGEKTELKFYLKKGNKKFRPVAQLNLPQADVLLASNEPIRVSAEELGQPFGLVIVREIDARKDKFSVSFTNADMSKPLATAQFRAKAKKIKYDKGSNSFLETYQKVKRKNRGLVFKINGEVDWMVDFGKNNWGGKTLDHIVNYGGMILIAPWVYARYSNVKWLIGDVSLEQTQKKWKNVLDKNPVVDYVSWVHAGDQHDHYLNYEGKKENQLRLAYTGACDSKGSEVFIERYGAAGAAGHAETSASPVWQFGMVKKWTYGFSLKNTAKFTWKSGVRKVRALEWITFAKLWQEKKGVMDWKNVDDLINQSEIMVSHTDEIPSSKMYIDLSTVVSEKKSGDQITTKKVTDIIKEDSETISID